MINKTHIPPGPVRRSRIDWSDVKHRLDLGIVATNLLGPPRLRSGKRLLWLCPFHDDRNPSLQVDLARKTWRCWACAIGGDAAALVRRVNGWRLPGRGRVPGGAFGSDHPIKGRKPTQPRFRGQGFPAPAGPHRRPSGIRRAHGPARGGGGGPGRGGRGEPLGKRRSAGAGRLAAAG